MNIKQGQRYVRPDGSHVRVDSVGKGQVYFVSWKPEQEQGCAIRMLITDFKIALRNERMEPAACVECPCCGWLAAEGLCEDGQPLLCGCAGQISLCAETEPWANIGDEECPPGAKCREDT